MQQNQRDRLNPQQIALKIKAKAKEIGFSLVGITGDSSRKSQELFDWWLEQGFGANMFYLNFQKQRRKSITEILPEAKSTIVCALRFPAPSTSSNPELHREQAKDEDGHKVRGKIARYASGTDYHYPIKEMLDQLAVELEKYTDESVKSLSYVDTGAIPERTLASQAGLGWIGKNSMLIHPEEGSWFWLGEIITSLKLPHDDQILDHCGSCTKCIDACPTDAIKKDQRAIDSRKCISYWNIEHKGDIPKHMQSAMDDWLLGCDICQEVCPWNDQSLRKSRKDIGAPQAEYMELDSLFEISGREFQRRYKESAISRPRLAGLKRNAKIVTNNLSENAKRS